MCNYCFNNTALCTGTLNLNPACQSCINNARNNGGYEYDVRKFHSVRTISKPTYFPHKYSRELSNEYLLLLNNNKT
jgi:hypothetical protein